MGNRVWLAVTVVTALSGPVGAKSFADVQTETLESNISELVAAKGASNEQIITQQMLSALANAAAGDVPNGDFRALSAIRLYQATGTVPSQTVRWPAKGADGSPITCIASRQSTQIVWNGHSEMNPSERRWRANCQATSPAMTYRVEEARLWTRERLKQRLRDPEGSRYRDVVATFGDQGIAICGEVNMRNGFGGFTGYQKFLATTHSLRLPTDEELSSVWIARDWPEFCTGPGVRVVGPVKVD